ncbi:putative AlkP superfamily pyrophosphatase or phosphodiesterase [Luteibacter rhizovicinus]|uniref:Putative AlkP superfamily pyrophosphatase or phosphodiesterase n=1 Tax=Luteibacter rhizovicinus TaxID=242606 RepID=A0A4R3YFI4_9GAMM|nr:ectonucleotide pyrophosphatase/phosphodiesterase [Luteibacter rhizovicinus]TCV91315.1 putative AlkP superfamily pyrophosphatase or phosphodiesterase [Luteibacter rhizovicinus]
MNFSFRPLVRGMLPFIMLLALAGCGTTATKPPVATRHPVLLISIDAFRPDYLDRGQTPTLASIVREGARAPYMRPSFPSLTFPNHYTLVTGLVPDHHGVVNNTMVDPKIGRFRLADRDATSDGRWWDGAEPLWVTAQKQGLRTATMFWPGTEAEIRGMRPDRWIPYDGDLTSNGRVDQLLKWIDEPGPKPMFDTLYFDAVDHAGHEHGPDSPEVDVALRETDAALARLVAGLKARGIYDSMDILVVSDHGMANLPSDHIIFADDVADVTQLDEVSYGVVATFNPLPAHGFARPEAALLASHPHMQCYRKGDLPARFQYGTNPRVPAIVCMAETGWTIVSHAALAARTTPMSLGEHGYDNADPTMRALFVARGPSFQPGATVAPFPNVDVYPLIVHLLGISGQPNDGNLGDIEGLLRPAAR